MLQALTLQACVELTCGAGTLCCHVLLGCYGYVIKACEFIKVQKVGFFPIPDCDAAIDLHFPL